MQAVILAGGKGQRMLPYTIVLPKPLLPIGDRPIIDVILHQLKYFGFDKITVSTGYLHELIHAYLNTMKNSDLNLTFTYEHEPLGTIGPLNLIENLDDDFLVMNGDILTDLNYRSIFDIHKKRKAVATIATYRREYQIDFGVLEKDNNNNIISFIEKPKYYYEVSMGIYILSKKILEYIPKNKPYGFDQLIYALLDGKELVYSYPHLGYWLDIGMPHDYARSVDEFEQYKNRLLP